MISDGTYRQCDCCGELFAEGDVRGRTMCSCCEMAGCALGEPCKQANLTGRIVEQTNKSATDVTKSWRDRPPLL